MDFLEAQHRELEQGKWAEMPFSKQIANIGSEVSRAIKWHEKGKSERAQRAVYRALELIDFSIAAAQKLDMPMRKGRLKELCRCREELCSFFLDDNLFGSSADSLQRYFDQFALLSR